MRKTDKKMDNQLRHVLTEVCEVALKDINGFQWLTHVVNYSNFPKSLQVVCVLTPMKTFLISCQKKPKLNLMVLFS